MGTARQIYWIVILIAAISFFGSLFVNGLRQRKIISSSNLDIERDRAPIMYWTVQAYYVLAVLVFIALAPLVVVSHKIGTWPIDMPDLALSGGFFLLGAVVMTMIFIIGLRTGVAIRRAGPFERPAPSRKEHPVRYWGLQFFYLFFAVLTAALGTACVLVVIQK